MLTEPAACDVSNSKPACVNGEPNVKLCTTDSVNDDVECADVAPHCADAPVKEGAAFFNYFSASDDAAAAGGGFCRSGSQSGPSSGPSPRRVRWWVNVGC